MNKKLKFNDLKAIKNKWICLNTQLLDGIIGSEIFANGEKSIKEQIKEKFGDRIPPAQFTSCTVDELIKACDKILDRRCQECYWYRSGGSICFVGPTDTIISPDDRACQLFL